MAIRKYTKGKNYFKELKTLVPNAVRPLTSVYVTAIIVTDKGIFKGVNYENTICSLSMCAERTAIYGAIAYGMKRIYEIHILPSLPGMTMCGACRQLALSFSTDSTRVYTYNRTTGSRTEMLLGQLVPKATLLAKIGD